MLKRGRSRIAAFMACIILLVVTAPAYPSYNSEAGHKYTVACQRLADLRKSVKKKQYRSYWMDCIRTFELVEKKYPRSLSAGDACFDRAGVFQDLYLYNKYSKDLDAAIQLNGKCQIAYPGHVRAPEALYHIVELSLGYKKDSALASENVGKLVKAYPDSVWTGKARALINPPVTAASKPGKQEPNRRTSALAKGAGKSRPFGVVKNIRYWSGGTFTRIVIDRDKPIKYLAQELKNPDRLVFDILNSRVDASVNKDPMPVNDGILRQVRANQHSPNVVRVVLDLASIKSYVAFPLHNPDRLVIDVTGEGVKSPESAVASGEANTQEKEQSTEVQAAEEQTREEQTPEEQVSAPGAEIRPEPEPEISAPPLRKPPEIKSAENGKLSLSRQMGLKIRTIAIDAGHGGHDPGAIGRYGLKEKNVTLDIAKRLAVLVKERLGCNVIMTRDRDVFIRLEDRPAIAKTKGADLFVSIHINSNRKRNTRGIETYVQSLRASDREAMATAARENAMSTKKLSELKSELDRIFADLTRDDKIEESLYLADSVQGSLVSSLKPFNRHATDLKARMKRAFFYVLINTEMPSILAEVGFISNPEEEKLLGRDSYRQSIAEALCQGIKKYIEARGPQSI
ncbi:MAG TPA: N-acetylmuramoyl-L-alanine amidase [Nitrospirota bacterium]